MRTVIFFFIIIFFFSCKREDLIIKDKSILDSKYSTVSVTDKKKYLDSITTVLYSSSNDSLKINYLFEIAAEYYYLEDNKSSFETSKKIFDLAKKNADSVSMGRSLYYMGDCYEDYQKDSAYYYYKESEKIFRTIKDNDKLAKALFNKAHLLFTEGNYVESEVEVIKALQQLEKSKKFTLLFKCYYLQACNHIELEEFDNANNYLNLAKESLNKVKESKNGDTEYKQFNELIIIGLCNLYDKKKDYKNSKIALEKLATPKLKQQNLTVYSTVMGNLAYVNMKLGNLDESKKQFEESIALAKKSNNVPGYLYKIISFGEYYLLSGDTIAANKYFNLALPLSKKLKSSSDELKTLNLLATSDVKNASFYKSEYLRVTDSIVKQQRFNREKFTRIEYETDKVDGINKVLSKENLILFFGLVATVIAFLTFIIFRIHLARKKEMFLIAQKARANDELFSLIKEFQLALVQTKEDEQNRISRELHDGVVNQIYAIRMVLETLNTREDLETQQKRITYIKELNKVELEIRELSHEMHTDFSRYDDSFIFLIDSLITNNNELKRINFRAEISETIDWDNYSSIIKINIYRIIQEAFLNVNKYSEAKNCFLKIVETDVQLIINCKDDGVGFDSKKISEGIGLKNIRDRAKSIDAKLSISSVINNGVEINLEIEKEES